MAALPCSTQAGNFRFLLISTAPSTNSTMPSVRHSMNCTFGRAMPIYSSLACTFAFEVSMKSGVPASFLGMPIPSGMDWADAGAGASTKNATAAVIVATRRSAFRNAVSFSKKNPIMDRSSRR